MNDLRGMLFLLFAIFEPEKFDKLNKNNLINRDALDDRVYRPYFKKVFGHEPQDDFFIEYTDMG